MAHAYSICKPGNSGAPKSNLVDSSIIAKNNGTDRAEARQLASTSWVEFMRTPSAKDMTRNNVPCYDCMKKTMALYASQ